MEYTNSCYKVFIKMYLIRDFVKCVQYSIPAPVHMPDQWTDEQPRTHLVSF